MDHLPFRTANRQVRSWQANMSNALSELSELKGY